MNDNLFYAILSMDAYNRSSNSVLNLPSGAAAGVGGAVLIGRTEISGDSFFEQTYL